MKNQEKQILGVQGRQPSPPNQPARNQENEEIKEKTMKFQEKDTRQPSPASQLNIKVKDQSNNGNNNSSENDVWLAGVTAWAACLASS